MTNPTPVSAVKSIKIVEITAQKPLGHDKDGGRKVIMGFGEAGIYAKRAEKAGIELSRVVSPNTVMDSLVITDTGLVTLDDKVEHIAFVTSRHSIENKAFDMDLYRESLMAAVEGQERGTELVMTQPGTYEGNVEEANARAELMGAWLTERGFKVTWKRAGADLPREVRESLQGVKVSFGDFQVEGSDLVLVGSRRLNRERMQDALRTVAGMVLESVKPSRLIVPCAVGVNLAAAEAAVSAGIPVVMFCIGSQPETWVQGNQDRLQALQNAGVTLIGDFSREWERGLITASVQEMSKLAELNKAKVACIDDPLGSEAQALKGAKNLYPQVLAVLRDELGDSVVDAALQVPEAKQQAAQVLAQPAGPVSEFVIPF